MAKRVKIRPVSGTVLNPDRGMRPLDPKGEEVLFSSYWERRRLDGEIEIVEDKKAKKAAGVAGKGDE